MNNLFESQLKELFEKASKSHVQFIYTLVRVSGFGEGPDQLINIKLRIDSFKGKVTDNSFYDIYKDIINNNEIYKLIVNLLYCSDKKNYCAYPFTRGATPILMVNNVLEECKKFDLKELMDIIKKTFDTRILAYFEEQYSEDISYEYEKYLTNLRSFLANILNLYFEYRLKYLKYNKLYKLPNYMVLETIIDDTYGICGFIIYHSNGSYSQYNRTQQNTFCSNITLSKNQSVELYCGDVSKLKNEYMIKGKRLYEVGLPGRYNKPGEWKPIIYPDDTFHLQKEAESMSDDSDVQGVFFYMLCTGHRVIEFVVRTTLVLPSELVDIGNKYHLYRCTKNNEVSDTFNEVYDGWVELESGSVEEIESTLRNIGLILNILSFTYKVSIRWRIKYCIKAHNELIATPNIDDLKLANNILDNILINEDKKLEVNHSLDWYVKGRTSKNIFVEFLSYYISFESLALSIYNENENSENSIKCIQSLFDQIYSNNPEQFVKEAYFNCVVGITKRTKIVAKEIFGENNSYIQLLFKKAENRQSLCDIRGKLARGKIAHYSKQDEKLVRERISELRLISWEFLLRVILNLKPTDKLPEWSGLHKVSLSLDDPRNTLSCSDGKMFPKDIDWNIKPEWID